MLEFGFSPYLIVVVVLLVIFFFKFRATPERVFNYKSCRFLLSPAERSFYGVLVQAVSADIVVIPKVRVADVITPSGSKGRSDWYSSFNKISSKHFDFVLCYKSDFSFFCALELNDSSHRKVGRGERDKFLAEACLSAGVRLVQVSAQRSYSVVELVKILEAPVDCS